MSANQQMMLPQKISAGGASFTRATGNSGADTSGGSGTTQATSAFNLASGSLVVVVASATGNGSGISSVADTAGNTYTARTSQSFAAGANGRMRVFYCLNATGNASNVVTVTYGNSCEYRAVFAQSYTYTGTASYVAEGNGSGNSTAAVGASMTAGTLAVGGVTSGTHGTALTPNSGWTKTFESTGCGAAFLDRTDSPGGTITCGATTPDDYWGVAAATFSVS